MFTQTLIAKTNLVASMYEFQMLGLNVMEIYAYHEDVPGYGKTMWAMHAADQYFQAVSSDSRQYRLRMERHINTMIQLDISKHK